MSGLDVNCSNTVCRKCGKSYSRVKGFFPVSHSLLYKGTGYLPYCRDCIEGIFSSYLEECQSAKDACRQVCRKLDLYWSQNLFSSIEMQNTSHTIMSNYLLKINATKYAGKSYDDTLREEGKMWSWAQNSTREILYSSLVNNGEEADNDFVITEDIIEFWGEGYSAKTYQILENKKNRWNEKLPEWCSPDDIAIETLIRQICLMEFEIDRERLAGRPTTKLVDSLNSLVGSMNAKPAQKKSEESSYGSNAAPLGVLLYKYENKRPLPEIDDDLKDVNGIKKYVFTWLGHLCKMLGKKNGFSRLYEEEIQKYRVEHPEYSGENNEELYMDILSETEAIEI